MVNALNEGHLISKIFLGATNRRRGLFLYSEIFLTVTLALIEGKFFSRTQMADGYIHIS